jgi:hypothetical protein
LCLHVLSPDGLKTPRITVGQLVVAIGVSFLLADIFLFSVRTIPFTHLHRGAITDLPVAVVRYFILFPSFVAIAVHQEAWIEASIPHLLKTLFILAAAHLLLQKAQAQSLQQYTVDIPPDDTEEFPQRLGLRDT